MAEFAGSCQVAKDDGALDGGIKEHADRELTKADEGFISGTLCDVSVVVGELSIGKFSGNTASLELD